MLTSLSPAGLVLLMTPFTRFVIVFSRSPGLLQQSPPNQVLIGLSANLSLR
jgi:flagellar biosynthesis protein FliP